LLSGPCGLGHQLLRTSGVRSAGLSQCDGDVLLSMCGRLDNRMELARAVGVDLCSDAVSDSELLLIAHRKIGPELPKRLLGDFAYALYDKGSGCLMLVRDHMGVQPLYYGIRGQVEVIDTLTVTVVDTVQVEVPDTIRVEQRMEMETPRLP